LIAALARALPKIHATHFGRSSSTPPVRGFDQVVWRRIRVLCRYERRAQIYDAELYVRISDAPDRRKSTSRPQRPLSTQTGHSRELRIETPLSGRPSILHPCGINSPRPARGIAGLSVATYIAVFQATARQLAYRAI